MEDAPQNLSGAEEYIAAEPEMAEEIGLAGEKAIRDAVARSADVRSAWSAMMRGR